MPDEEVTLPLVAVEALLAASFSACREQSRRRRRRAPWYVPLVASRAAVRLALPKTSTYFGVLAGLTDSTDLLSAAEGRRRGGRRAMRIFHVPVDYTGPQLPPGAPRQYGAMVERPAPLAEVYDQLEFSMFQVVMHVVHTLGKGHFAVCPRVYDAHVGPRSDWPHPYWYFEYLPQTDLDDTLHDRPLT